MIAMKLADHILAHFPSAHDGRPPAGLTLVEDPDSVIADEEIFGVFRARGYCVSVFTETLELRRIYEWRAHGNADAREVVIFRGGENLERVVPPDILNDPSVCRLGGFMYGKLFPMLDRGVLMQLGRDEIAALFRIRGQADARGCRPNDTEKTCEFVFEDLWGRSATAITTHEILFATLAWLHVEKCVTSPTLLRYFRKCIRGKAVFADGQAGRVPLPDEVLTDAGVFRDWANTLWRGKWAGNNDLQIDLDVQIVREAFVMLHLAGVIAVEGDADAVAKELAYLADGRGDGALDFALAETERDMPKVRSSWRDWTQFARNWAALTATMDTRKIDVLRYGEVWNKIDNEFAAWISWAYASLANVPSAVPPVVYRTIESISAARKTEGFRKFALVVVDGMAWKDWAIIRRRLEGRFDFSINGTFAAVPTVTSVSRQAIFSGKPPLEFADSINSTSRESILWREAWAAREIEPAYVKYKRGLGLGDAKSDVAEYFTNCHALGLVVDSIDEMTHGTIAGNRELASRIEDWLEGGYLETLLSHLVEELRFEVFVTSDHGNIEATGTGNLREGQAVETRGERVRVYANDILRDAAKAKLAPDDAMAWECADLPEKYSPLIKTGRGAFAPNGEKLMAHGGISVEETIVPFVRVRRKGSRT